MRKRRNGFSLLELMVVLVITGILGTIGISSYLDSLDNAKNSQVVANETEVRLALEAYASDNDDNYPFATPTYTVGMSPSTDHSGLTAPAFLGKGYLKGDKLPIAPWYHKPQDADMPDGFQGSSWAQVQQEASSHTAITQGTLALDPPDAANAFGALRYMTDKAVKALNGQSGGSTHIYYLSGVGKRRDQCLILQPYCNSL